MNAIGPEDCPPSISGSAESLKCSVHEKPRSVNVLMEIKDLTDTLTEILNTYQRTAPSVFRSRLSYEVRQAKVDHLMIARRFHDYTEQIMCA